MVFNKQWWPQREWFQSISLHDVEAVSQTHVYGQPTLELLFYGSAGMRVDALSEEESKQEALTVLRQMFRKSKIPDPVRVYASHWWSDPHARGAYSFQGVGSSPQSFREVASTVNGVLAFAGEHCSYDYIGSVHGAYLAGVDAAKRISA
eukprot:NODE_7569_length_757_cov_91.380126_g7321_i0.p1 GENE.NODE_7569_length_757_cov_91.380126_g7321_i0~~NODE_7569_length_757_cov_91.380126_g7321_i0.p1  ORF type:complete len:149 (+),score=4.45 NODE_7569_length_757_cov_91.380126_g7321_i0:214-660(+)